MSQEFVLEVKEFIQSIYQKKPPKQKLLLNLLSPLPTAESDALKVSLICLCTL